MYCSFNSLFWLNTNRYSGVTQRLLILNPHYYRVLTTEYPSGLAE